MKRILVILVLTAYTILPKMSFAKQEYYHVGELRELTQDGWHQTHETEWRTIRIDADIEIPEVDVFPVIRVE